MTRTAGQQQVWISPRSRGWPVLCHCPARVIHLQHIPRDLNGGLLCPRACFQRSWSCPGNGERAQGPTVSTCCLKLQAPLHRRRYLPDTRQDCSIWFIQTVTGPEPSAGGSRDTPQPLPQDSVPLTRAHQVFPASMPPPVLMGSSVPHRASCPSLSELVLSCTSPPRNVCPVHSFFL